MKRLLIIIISVLVFAGCYIIPKDVELFQDKVKPVPEKSAKLVEAEKQAALTLKYRVNQSRDAALQENASTNIINPLNEARLLAEPLSLSLGAPERQFDKKVEDLVAILLLENSRLDRKLDLYRNDTRENVGKKIEGTGVMQVSWFTAIFWTIGVVFLISVAIKIIGIIYPPVGIGANLMRIPSSIVKNGFSQLIAGGESFKREVDRAFEDEKTKQKIKELFRISQERVQDKDIQDVVKKLTI